PSQLQGPASFFGPIGQGLTAFSFATDRFFTILNTLASDNRANIVSSPHVLPSENKKAVINVSTSVPRITGQPTSPARQPGPAHDRRAGYPVPEGHPAHRPAVWLQGSEGREDRAALAHHAASGRHGTRRREDHRPAATLDTGAERRHQARAAPSGHRAASGRAAAGPRERRPGTGACAGVFPRPTPG